MLTLRDTMLVNAVSVTQKTQYVLFLTENNTSSTRFHLSLVDQCLNLLVLSYQTFLAIVDQRLNLNKCKYFNVEGKLKDILVI